MVEELNWNVRDPGFFVRVSSHFFGDLYMFTTSINWKYVDKVSM